MTHTYTTTSTRCPSLPRTYSHLAPTRSQLSSLPRTYSHNHSFQLLIDGGQARLQLLVHAREALRGQLHRCVLVCDDELEVGESGEYVIELCLGELSRVLVALESRKRLDLCGGCSSKEAGRPSRLVRVRVRVEVRVRLKG